MKRKLLFSALVAIVMTILLPTKVVAEEMYAEFDTNESTLTFKYDDDKPTANTETIKVYSFPNTVDKSPDWLTEYATSIKKVEFDASFELARPTSCYYWFKGCNNLTEIKNLDYLNTSSVTNMSGMFSGCSGLTSLNLSSFDTSIVETMTYMFNNCSKLTSLDLSNFDTSIVTSMTGMFSGCSKLTSLNLSNFDTSKVTTMQDMFSGCSGLTSLDLSNFNTQKVTTMSNMFGYCRGLTSLIIGNNFDTSSVKDMSHMFRECSGLENLGLSNFNTSSVTNMEFMFSGCSGLISLDLSSFDTSNVTNMLRMFVSCSGLTSLDLSSFDTSEVTNMSYMFYACSGLTSLDLSSFDTSQVTSMHQMFFGCSSLKSLDLSNFDTSKVTTMYQMFYDCTNLKTIFASDNYKTANVTASGDMFTGCTSLVGAISYDSNKTNADYANYTTGYFTNVVPTGEGTTNSPYLIKNAKHLAWFRDNVNNDNVTACARLEADIDMSSVCHAAANGVEELSWTPIGISTNQWYGTFNGNNKTISNLYINSSELHQGLFGDVCDDNNRASIKDIIFEDVNIKRSNECLGVLVGYAYNADISGIVVNSGSVNGNKNVGGIAGLTSNVELSDCINRIDVTGDDNYVGGIVGFAEGTSAIKNCANYGNVEGMSAGGIVGQTFGVDGNITLENVFSSGDVTYTNNSNEAGLVVGLASNGLTISGYVVYNSDAKIYYNNTVQDSKAIGVKNGNANVTGEDNIKGLPHEVLKTGEGTWMLNGLSSTGVWGQQLGTDDYPVPGSDYKVIKAAIGKKDANGYDVYWATFSNYNFDFDLGDLEAYTVKVSEGQMTLTPTADKTVAQGEGVLVKGSSEYLNAKSLNVTNASPEGNNDLVATLPTAQTITADSGYILYRLTYKDATKKTDLGFYLAVADGVKDGSKLKSTPGKAYLKVATSAATSSSSAAPAYSFILPGDNNTTGIGEIIIEGNNDGNASAKGNDRIYNLQGQQVTTPTKGLYIRNNKKVIIK